MALSKADAPLRQWLRAVLHVMSRGYDWVAFLACDVVVTDVGRSLESVLLVHAGNTSVPRKANNESNVLYL